MEYRAIRVLLEVDAGERFSDYTARLTKTFIHALNQDVLSLIRGFKGVPQPLHISPLFTRGRREWELGDVVTPRYVWGEDGWRLEPVRIEGEYLLHVGGEAGLVDMIRERLERAGREMHHIKIGDRFIPFKVEAVEDVTSAVMEKELSGGKVALYLKAPTLLFNVYAKSRLPKFSPTAVEVLMTPFLLRSMRSMDYSALVEASSLLGHLVETYYSLNTLKPVMIPFRGRREAALMGRITYLVEDRERIRREVEEILRLAEILGVGESRMNGFGTVSWTSR